MDRYLAKLHKKPDHHKKRFALLASGTITLFIFGVWSLATFGVSGISEKVVVEKNEVSPFESLRMSLGSSFEALKNSFKELETGALEIYGR